ncbi:MAG: DUF1861 family protein [Streptococcaceae bacterium]|nr:DUF1861 family protein [Streptococcaceae bacterium]
MFKSEELVEKHRNKSKVYCAEKLIFGGVEDYDVYNISAPFELNHQLILAGRVEARDSEHSQIRFFYHKSGNQWQLIDEAQSFNLQDPFFTRIDEKIILGGVEVTFDGEKVLYWRTIFYELNDLKNAKLIFSGPMGMKDIRLRELANGKILVLTRPQGVRGGLGKIGVVVIDDLSKLSIDLLEKAPLLKNQYVDEEWGGANEIHLVGNRVAVLGHIGSRDYLGNIHYRAMTFELDENFTEILNPKIIAERKDFVAGPSKRPDLMDVVFSGGLIFKEDKVVLYAGTGDAEAQKLVIDDPFR